MNYFIAALGALLICFIFAFCFLFKKYEVEKALNVELQAKLESISKDNKTITPKEKVVIEYRDKKIDVIKRIPYENDTCKSKLDSYNKLINSF